MAEREREREQRERERPSLLVGGSPVSSPHWHLFWLVVVASPRRCGLIKRERERERERDRERERQRNRDRDGEKAKIRCGT